MAVNLRKKITAEEIPSSSMSDIAFLLLVFFMVASVFYVKEGILSSLPKKDSAPQKVVKENVYLVQVTGPQIKLEHPSIRVQQYPSHDKFREELKVLEIPNLPDKFAVLSAQSPTTVQEMVEVLGIIRERGFQKISLQKPK